MKSDSPDTTAKALSHEIWELRRRFLSEVEELRPALHRYCQRMLGSSLDAEDTVQDVLTQAFYRLPSLRDDRALRPWLIRMAHNRCIDALRKRNRAHQQALDDAPLPSEDVDRVELSQEVAHALAHLISALPPKERGAFLLREVFDYSTEEIADVIGSTPGGVKSALHRGREKLQRAALSPPPPALPLTTNDDLLRRYVEAFNARDRDRIQALIRDDARLELVGFGDSPLGTSYFTNYDALPWTWQLRVGSVDGERVVLHYRMGEDGWYPYAAIRMRFSDGRVQTLRDYVHIPYVLAPSVIEDVGSAEP